MKKQKVMHFISPAGVKFRPPASQLSYRLPGQWDPRERYANLFGRLDLPAASGHVQMLHASGRLVLIFFHSLRASGIIWIRWDDEADRVDIGPDLHFDARNHHGVLRGAEREGGGSRRAQVVSFRLEDPGRRRGRTSKLKGALLSPTVCLPHSATRRPPSRSGSVTSIHSSKADPHPS